jgi:hypothetical protein
LVYKILKCPECILYAVNGTNIYIYAQYHFVDPTRSNCAHAHAHAEAPTRSRLPTRITMLWIPRAQTVPTRMPTLRRPRVQNCPRASPCCGSHAQSMPSRMPTLRRPRVQDCPRASSRRCAHALKNAHAHFHAEACTRSRMPLAHGQVEAQPKRSRMPARITLWRLPAPSSFIIAFGDEALCCLLPSECPRCPFMSNFVNFMLLYFLRDS